jgi:predicted glutamine amidotransferase
LITDEIYQSFRCKERSTPLNGDGFGVAWYVPEIRDAPGIFKAITPAWNNRNLLSLCGVTKSHCILAHVRAATQGIGISEANCHPFSWKNLSFMHNGDIGCHKGNIEIVMPNVVRSEEETVKSVE